MEERMVNGARGVYYSRSGGEGGAMPKFGMLNPSS
jgi:hypothetical protein